MNSMEGEMSEQPEPAFIKEMNAVKNMMHVFGCLGCGYWQGNNCELTGQRKRARYCPASVVMTAYQKWHDRRVYD